MTSYRILAPCNKSILDIEDLSNWCWGAKNQNVAVSWTSLPVQTKWFKLAHRYTEFAAAATLILQSIFVLSLHAETSLSASKDAIPLHKKYNRLNNKERAGDWYYFWPTLIFVGLDL